MTPGKNKGALPLRPPPQAPLEVWGGVECTVNRVGDQYFDQLVWNHHASHPEDLDRFAALGLRTLRYPVLWERTAPDGIARADWSWADERLGRLRDPRYPAHRRASASWEWPTHDESVRPVVRHRTRGLCRGGGGALPVGDGLHAR